MLGSNNANVCSGLSASSRGSKEAILPTASGYTEKVMAGMNTDKIFVQGNLTSVSKTLKA